MIKKQNKKKTEKTSRKTGRKTYFWYPLLIIRVQACLQNIEELIFKNSNLPNFLIFHVLKPVLKTKNNIVVQQPFQLTLQVRTQKIL